MLIPLLFSGKTSISSFVFSLLLSFGIIGLACLVPYIYDNCKRLYKVKEHYSYIALVMGFIGVLLIHGILDYTIFWIHTGLFFLFVLSSFEMFETNRN